MTVLEIPKIHQIRVNENTIKNIVKVVHIIQQSQINLDILLEAFSDQSQPKSTWKSIFFPES